MGGRATKCAALLGTTLTLLAISASAASAAAPVISDVGFSQVTETSVTLEAKISPSKRTSYHFEYGAADCSLPSSNCTNAPAFDAKIDPAEAPVPVAATVGGLTPGTTYHFRLVARNTSTPTEVTESPDATFSTFHTEQSFAPCPNAAFRTGPSARLPDCRAYEQVSSVDKKGGDANGFFSYAYTSPSGDAATYMSYSNLPGLQGSQEIPTYLARREAGEWSNRGLLPPQDAGEEGFVLGWAPDLSRVFDSAAHFGAPGNQSLLSLSPGGSPSTLIPYDAGLGNPPFIAGFNADGSELVFESNSGLPPTAGLAGKPNVYVYDQGAGALSLASVFNDGSPPTAGALAGAYAWGGGGASGVAVDLGGTSSKYYTQDLHAVSVDGSVFFTAAKTAQLYLRRNPTQPQSPMEGGKCKDPSLACTVHVSASQRLTPDTLGPQPAAFMGATPDGSKAFFTSSEKLTEDANTGPEVPAPTIARANLTDGSEKKIDFIKGLHAQGLTAADGYLYWADSQAGTIGRAKLNGSAAASEPDFEFITGADNPRDVAVSSEYVYWTNAADEDEATGSIGRAKLGPLGALEVNQDFIEHTTFDTHDGTQFHLKYNPQGIAVDGSHIYWGDIGKRGNGPALVRSNLNGGDIESWGMTYSNPETKENPLLLSWNPIDIALTGESAYLVDFDGSAGRQSLTEQFDNNSYNNFYALWGRSSALTTDSSSLYWATRETDSIARTDLDSSNQQPDFITGAGEPSSLANDSEHLYWTANQASKPHPGNDLYRFDAGSGELTDLTPLASGNGAEVLGVMGASEDGSRVYFVANGDLDGASGPAQSGDCAGGFPLFNTWSFKGQCSLYLAEKGQQPRFIARLDGDKNKGNWAPVAGGSEARDSRVSADGSTLLITSGQRLTSYDNRGESEVYRYRVGEEGFGCISCNPTGMTPQLGGAGLRGNAFNFFQIEPLIFSLTLPRNLSPDGNRAFFQTSEALVPADVNGLGGCPILSTPTSSHSTCADTYEWEAKGTGSCDEEVQAGGCLYLISSGDGADGVYLSDASRSGDDAFIITRSQLVGQDHDQLYDVYDARVGGGIASQHPNPAPPCEAEGCKLPTPPTPASSSPGSTAFTGPPDPKPSRKKQKHRRAHKQKHGKQHHKRAAKAGRGSRR